jgi:Protein of unknown function (DUF3309)
MPTLLGWCCGSLGQWRPDSRSWGFYPSDLPGVILLIHILLLLPG